LAAAEPVPIIIPKPACANKIIIPKPTCADKIIVPKPIIAPPNH
jgi:hypothetical protein